MRSPMKGTLECTAVILFSNRPVHGSYLFAVIDNLVCPNLSTINLTNRRVLFRRLPWVKQNFSLSWGKEGTYFFFFLMLWWVVWNVTAKYFQSLSWSPDYMSTKSFFLFVHCGDFYSLCVTSIIKVTKIFIGYLRIIKYKKVKKTMLLYLSYIFSGKYYPMYILRSTRYIKNGRLLIKEIWVTLYKIHCVCVCSISILKTY